jgi:hypothetical protein
MGKIYIIKQHYSEEADEMEWLINSETPQPAISVRVDDYFYLRLNPETSEVVGATLFNASEWFARNCPYSPNYPTHKKVLWAFGQFRTALRQVFSHKSLADLEVQEYIREKLENFAA